MPASRSQMYSSNKSFLSRAKPPLLLLGISLLLAFPSGCAEPGKKKSKAAPSDQEALAEKLRSLNSVSHYLTAADLHAFRPGRLKEDVLEDVKWRGSFHMAAEIDRQSVCAIIYELRSDDLKLEGGVWTWALFVDDRFSKFVVPPPALPEDLEEVDVNGTPWSRTKPRKTGDDRFLVRAINAEPVTIDELKKEVKALTPPPEHIDPGLTAAYLALRAVGLAPGPEPSASETQHLKNAALRDQFNAARLTIGMTEEGIEAILKAKPIESGQVQAGAYRIYGSNESFPYPISNPADPWHHFSNILVVYREGKAVAIASVSAGDGWRQKLAQETVDLPQPAPSPPQ
ncbi:MAG TPA: hypothetical protein VGK58_05915 [Lacipirellulaceae bacterium]